MGIFSFFKKPKQELVPVKLKLDQVEAWIAEQLASQKVEDLLDTYILKIKDIGEDIKVNLQKLSMAVLMNEKIPAKEKQIMEGNRQHYIHKITLFLEHLPKPTNLEEAFNVSAELGEMLDRLSKDTHKNFYILQQFLADEVQAVGEKIKKIEQVTDQLHTNLQERQLDSLNALQLHLRRYREAQQVQEQFKFKHQEIRDEITELQKKEERIQEKVDGLLKSQGYQQLHSFKKKEDEIEEECQEICQPLVDVFAAMEKAIKKYAHKTSQEDFFQGYLDDPLIASQEDSSFKIFSELEKMKGLLTELGLKDKKAEATKKAINQFSKEMLVGILQQVELRELELDKISKLKSQNIVQLNISEQESWLENTKKKIEQKEAESAVIQSKLDKFDSYAILEDIKRTLAEIPQVELENE